MHFPFYFNLFGIRIHPHPFMEGLSYIVAITMYMRRRIAKEKFHSAEGINFQVWLLVGGIIGGLVGSHLLALWESGVSEESWFTLSSLFFGKTVLGGLVGGWIGIECVKRYFKVYGSTGDAWVTPICIGMAIGRIGCFLTGLSDNTYGTPTNFFWGVDFGDGIPRHPTQLYEFALLLAFIGYIHLQKSTANIPGRLFRKFMLFYATVRFFIEFIKPTLKPYFGISAIQLVALCLIGYLLLWFWNRRGKSPKKGLD